MWPKTKLIHLFFYYLNTYTLDRQMGICSVHTNKQYITLSSMGCTSAPFVFFLQRWIEMVQMWWSQSNYQLWITPNVSLKHVKRTDIYHLFRPIQNNKRRSSFIAVIISQHIVFFAFTPSLWILIYHIRGKKHDKTSHLAISAWPSQCLIIFVHGEQRFLSIWYHHTYLSNVSSFRFIWIPI